MMKKILFSALIMLFVVMSMSAQKFGYLNYRAVLLEMPEMASATAELEVLADQLRKKGEGMVTNLQTEYAALETRIGAGELSKVQQESEVAKLQEKQQQLGLFEQEMALEIQKKEATLLQPLLDRIQTAIDGVAKENGMQFIFDQGTQMLLFAEQSTDVTSMVKAKMGM